MPYEIWQGLGVTGQANSEPRWTNPLSVDRELFGMYMDALDSVLAIPEIRRSLEDFDLSTGNVRMRMVNEAGRILRSASREYDAYERALAGALSAHEIDSRLLPDASTSLPRRLRLLSLAFAIPGLLLALAALVGTAAGFSAPWLLPTGIAALGSAITLWLSEFGLRTAPGQKLSEFVAQMRAADLGPLVGYARGQLMAAVSENELLAQVRTLINTARQGRFGLFYSVASNPGLSEAYDSTNRVSTETEAELTGLLDRFEGASIGVAGPRGAGKSTLIREYCEEGSTADSSRVGRRRLSDPSAAQYIRTDVRCLVAAPVDYVPRDFVLHLFATFCRAVINAYGKARSSRRGSLRAFWARRIFGLAATLIWRAIPYACYASVLLLIDAGIARKFHTSTAWVLDPLIALTCIAALALTRSAVSSSIRWAKEAKASGQALDGSLAALARQHLTKVRYLQTYTSGWSGGLGLPNGASAQLTRGVSRAEQVLTYPEIVDEFRAFASTVASDAHARRDRVFIGVDELDKIGSTDQAENFLNEIKGIFGIPYLYFMVSVSDDALTAFERRGLPLRDAFDSSFDEILYVGPLSYAESRRLLYRRIIGLTEPYVALCHCLAGGLARDVIRAARQVARSAAKLMADEMRADMRDAGDDLAESLGREDGATTIRQPLALASIAASVIYEDMRRKLRALSQVVNRASPDDASLQHLLHDIALCLGSDQPLINIVDLIIKPNDPDATPMSNLRLDFATYAYYCATLREIFINELSPERILAASSDLGTPGSFDALAAARNSFSLDTTLAWRLITQCRKAWSLETREAPVPV